MEKIKLVFLGTGSAIPTEKRNHPAMLLNYKDENILIDCGEGTQKQFRIAKLNPCKLTKILITHWHGDHVLGLPGLMQTLMLNGYKKTLHVYGPRGTEKKLSLYLSLFVHKDKISVQVHEIEKGKLYENAEFFIEAMPMSHETPTLAYSFVIKEKNRLDKQKLKKLKLPNSPEIAKLKDGKDIIVNGRKIIAKQLIYKEPARKITFILDTLENKNAVALAKNSDLLVCESTYSNDEIELAKKHFHLTSGQAAGIAKLSKSKKLILTHLSQKYDKNHLLIEKQAKKIFKNTKIADDFDKVEI